MTLIAFTSGPDGADIITDTLSYRHNGHDLGYSSKVHPLGHLDAVLITQGSSEFGRLWRYSLDRESEQVSSFDDLNMVALYGLPVVWREYLETLPPDTNEQVVIFHIGYSRAHERFKAFAYSSAKGFAAHDVTDEFCLMPQPITETRAPTSVDEWVALAVKLRNERALAPWGELKCFVGGTVHHTRLERGSLTQRRVHTFDDSGPEFLKMISGTCHPLAQLSDCGCGSGKLQALCHFPEPGTPCGCRSGKPFDTCCAVTPLEIAQALATREAELVAGHR